MGRLALLSTIRGQSWYSVCPSYSKFILKTHDLFAKGLAKVGGDQSASFLCTSMWLAPWSLKG